MMPRKIRVNRLCIFDLVVVLGNCMPCSLIRKYIIAQLIFDRRQLVSDRAYVCLLVGSPPGTNYSKPVVSGEYSYNKASELEYNRFPLQCLKLLNGTPLPCFLLRTIQPHKHRQIMHNKYRRYCQVKHSMIWSPYVRFN